MLSPFPLSDNKIKFVHMMFVIDSLKSLGLDFDHRLLLLKFLMMSKMRSKVMKGLEKRALDKMRLYLIY